jgi:riboflavin-specific deaminase-like protein
MKLPFVFLNVAMTADGKIATANGAIASFGSARDRRHLLELRATADAVMCGAATVNSGPISLGPGGARYRRLRLKRGLAEFNLRIVVSGSGSVNPDAQVFRRTFSPVIVLVGGQVPQRRLEKLRVRATEVKVCGRSGIDFRRALIWLREKWNVKRLLCEGGGGLNDALFRAGLVDEVHLTVCPMIFGGRTGPTIADGLGAGALAQAANLVLKSARRHHDELFLVYKVKH